MPAFTVRIDDPNLLKALDAKARARVMSREALVKELIAAEVGDFDPGLILGYVKLTNSELDPDDDDCPECNTPFGNGGVFIGFTPVGHFGPLCRRCALGN